MTYRQRTFFGAPLWALVLFAGLFLACRESPPDLDRPTDLSPRPDGGLDGPGDFADFADLPWPAPNPPLPSCYQRKPDVTAIQTVLRVDEYIGVKTGRNGPHEIVHATVVNTPWVYKASIVDTSNIEVSMNMKTETDPSGLPHEIPLRIGQQFEVEGEYIPKWKANATTNLGPAAVIHFTHSPCGYAVLGGIHYN